MLPKGKILAVDDDRCFIGALANAFDTRYELSTATSVPEAMKAISLAPPDVLLLDLNLPEMSGLEFLKLLKRRFDQLPVLVLTGDCEPETIVATMKAGADDYVIKGGEDFETNLTFRIDQLLAREALRRANHQLRDQNRGQAEANLKLQTKLSKEARSYEILGVSPTTLKLKSDILKFKGSNAFVMVSGENGTGKELVARALNHQEDDPARPFIALNCAAITPTLFESELFGHVKGAFTGATDNKAGQFKLADGGDIFLDEIGEVPLEMQAKLLRVLQEKTFTPVGSVKPISVDVRVIAATNRDLPKEVREGRFRQDLYYRLCQIEIAVPPLRDRADDIIFLAEEFLRRRLPAGRLSAPAKEMLRAFHWPGNIRELQNVVERAAILARAGSKPVITPEHLMLAPDLGRRNASDCMCGQLLPITAQDIDSRHFQRALAWIEREYLRQALRVIGGDNESLYQKLALSRAGYFRRKQSLGLSGPAERLVEVQL